MNCIQYTHITTYCSKLKYSRVVLIPSDLIPLCLSGIVCLLSRSGVLENKDVLERLVMNDTILQPQITWRQKKIRNQSFPCKTLSSDNLLRCDSVAPWCVLTLPQTAVQNPLLCLLCLTTPLVLQQLKRLLYGAWFLFFLDGDECIVPFTGPRGSWRR